MNTQEKKEVEEFLNPVWEDFKNRIFKKAEEEKATAEQVKNFLKHTLLNEMMCVLGIKNIVPETPEKLKEATGQLLNYPNDCD